MAAILRYLQEHQLIDSISTTIMIYLFVLILLLFLSFRYDINGKSKWRDVCYNLVLLLLILIAGLRWRLGTDTCNYIQNFYHSIPNLLKISVEDLGHNQLWILLNSIILTVGGKFFWVQLFQSVFVNCLTFKYIKKHSQYIFTCVFFYFIYSYFTQTMEEMKAGMAVVLCLFGNDYILEKKYLYGMSIYVLASLFHVSALLMLVTPFFLFLKWDKKGMTFLLLAYIAGYVIQVKMGEYLDLLEYEGNVADKLENYANSERYGNQYHHSGYR